jgi:ABC-type lipoprotein export system ATPase subunit
MEPGADSDQPPTGSQVDSAVARLIGVSRVFEGGVSALQDVSAVFKGGRSYAITGPSGSGKSTLLNVIGLLDRPTSGSYFLLGRDTARASEAERAELRRTGCGFVFQDFHLLGHRSVLENVMLGGFYSGRPRRLRAARALDLVGYAGLSQRARTPANRLSGGERQRVAIARALMNEPPLLLCDEPTGNLDSRNSHRIMDMLLDAGMDRTLIVVTHDDEVAARCQGVIMMLDGSVEASPHEA